MSQNSLERNSLLRIYQIVGDAKRKISPIVPVARSTWWSWVSSGRAPSPIKLGPRITVWRSEDIREFMVREGMIAEGGR